MPPLPPPPCHRTPHLTQVTSRKTSWALVGTTPLYPFSILSQHLSKYSWLHFLGLHHWVCKCLEEQDYAWLLYNTQQCACHNVSIEYIDVKDLHESIFLFGAMGTMEKWSQTLKVIVWFAQLCNVDTQQWLGNRKTWRYARMENLELAGHARTLSCTIEKQKEAFKSIIKVCLWC